MPITLPNDNDIGWGQTIRDAFDTIEQMITTKAENTHNHNELYPNITHNHDDTYPQKSHHHDDKYPQLTHHHNDLYPLISHHHDTEYANATHTHAITDLTDFALLLDDYSQKNIAQILLQGTSPTAALITFECHFTSGQISPLTIWEMHYHWGDIPPNMQITDYPLSTCMFNGFYIWKPHADDPVWINNNHTNLHIALRAKNPINNTHTNYIYHTATLVQKYSFIQVEDLVIAIKNNPEIIQAISNNVSQAVVLQSFIATNNQ